MKARHSIGKLFAECRTRQTPFGESNDGKPQSANDTKDDKDSANQMTAKNTRQRKTLGKEKLEK
jgi:hypothetical protein